jgi:hypothetical protein
MWTPTLVLIAITTLAAFVTLGGGLYEFLVVDPYWPKRPGIIQPRNGGVDEAAAVRWTRRSLLRLPLDLITCAGDARGFGGVWLIHDDLDRSTRRYPSSAARSL